MGTNLFKRRHAIAGNGIRTDWLAVFGESKLQSQFMSGIALWPEGSKKAISGCASGIPEIAFKRTYLWKELVGLIRKIGLKESLKSHSDLTESVILNR